MKKKLKLFVSATLAAAALTTAAGASDFDICADKLKDVGLFQGTAQGYDLDRAPTRAEAAVMLVRMLGKEADAKNLQYTAPFTDLKGWEAPYVQYLYDNKLTSGSSATTFSPDGQCSAQMYTTFLLRALGYSDANGDFTYDGSITFAKDKGLVDIINCDESNFLRDHVAAMSLTALNTPSKGSETRLLDHLVSNGAVDAAKAAPLQKFLNDIDAYNSANSKIAGIKKMDMSADIKASAKMAGLEVVSFSMPLQIQAEADPQNIKDMKMAMTGTMKMDASGLASALGGASSGSSTAVAGDETSAEFPVELYFKDGMYYINMEDEKVKMPLPMEDILEQMQVSSSEKEPISLIKSITAADGTYNITYNTDAMNSMVKKSMDAMQAIEPSAVDTSVSINSLSLNEKITDSNLSNMDMDMDMSMSVGAEGVTIDMDMSMKFTINKTGDEVTVNLPDDLDSYTDFDEALIEITDE